jgi:nucleotide-binding universal stress UspA family protein
MLINATERLIQFKRIAVLTDLSSESETMLRYAASLARWYRSEILMVHACSPESYASIPSVPLPQWPASGLPPKQEAENRIKAITEKLGLADLKPKVLIREATVGGILKEVGEHRPNLLVLATHGREGVRKWLMGSVTEEVFRKISWPVLVFGPGCVPPCATPQKQFERILYATDLSPVSVAALQYAASIAHDHEAQLIALYVEPDPRQGYSFDEAMAQQHLHDWLQDYIDGLAPTLPGAKYIVRFGKPELKIVEAAREQQADLIVLGARGLGAVASAAASHFAGGTAYEVCCSAPSPVLIVPH